MFLLEVRKFVSATALGVGLGDNANNVKAFLTRASKVIRL